MTPHLEGGRADGRGALVDAPETLVVEELLLLAEDADALLEASALVGEAVALLATKIGKGRGAHETSSQI